MVRACTVVALVGWTALCAQTPPHFEVASVQAARADAGGPGANVMRGGPGTADPGRILFTAVTMKRLLMTAYGVGTEQISGPGWIESERYAIEAKVPAGVGRQQVRAMLQALIAERFHLELHRETRVFPAFELTVSKRGLKLAPAQDPPPAPKKGFPEAAPGHYAAAMEDGISRLTFRGFAIAEFCRVLAIPLGTLSGNMLAAAAVSDQTGLTGTYDFTLEFEGYLGPGGAFPAASADGSVAAPSLFTALEAQMGLKLEEHKAPVEVLVIDRLEKAPAAN